MISKAWNWAIVDSKDWQSPCREYYYIAARWSGLGLRNVLDLGCGLGRNAIAFGKDGFKVSACDLSEYAINEAKANAKQNSVTNIDFKICDMLDLPYDSGEFDALFAHHVISHTDSKGIVEILKEINRVLKPCGECYVDILSKETWGYLQATNKVDENTIIKEDVPEEFGIPHYFANEAEILELFREFELIDIEKKARYDIKNGYYYGNYYYIHARKIN